MKYLLAFAFFMVILPKMAVSQGSTAGKNACIYELCNTCQDILNICDLCAQSGVYNLSSGLAWCEMIKGEGWLLLLKVDGRNSTFSYDSPFWNDDVSFQTMNAFTGLSFTEYKSPLYSKQSFTQVKVGMCDINTVNQSINWIIFNYSANNFLSIMQGGNEIYLSGEILRRPSITSLSWLSLLPSSPIQTGCVLTGFNIKPLFTCEGCLTSAFLRFGMLGDDSASSNCSDFIPDSWIGFGGKRQYGDDSLAVGSSCNKDCRYIPEAPPLYAPPNIVAFGYILIRSIPTNIGRCSNVQPCTAKIACLAESTQSTTIGIVVGTSVAIFVAILLIIVIYLRHKRNSPASATPFVTDDSSSILPISLEIKNSTLKRNIYDIFISLRFTEKGTTTGRPWKPFEAATLLKNALITQGYSVFLCAVENGDSIFDTVSDALKCSRFFVILGSETYGTPTESLCSTYQEMHFIIGKKRPFFLIKMCKEFELIGTQLVLDVGDIFFSSWKEFNEADPAIPAGLIDEIIAAFQRKTQSLNEFNGSSHNTSFKSSITFKSLV